MRITSAIRILVFLSLVTFSACEAGPSATPADALPSQEISASSGRTLVSVMQNTPIPTANLQPTPTVTLRPTDTPSPTMTFTPSLTPTDTPLPTNTPTPTPTPLPTSTLTPSPVPTSTLPPTMVPIASATPTGAFEDPNSTPLPTWTPPPPDPASLIADHYVFGRPISSSGTNWVDRNYPYGNTRGGRLQIHHGVEFVNPQGTPIKAVADGVVFYAGGDAETLFGPIFNYYGNLVVLQHAFTDASGQAVYTLYGHMARVEVATGQPVTAGDDIGIVGGTGVALGPHLHFEVRVGDPYNFYGVRNPELWIRPYGGYGTLAGRVTDSSGNILYDVTLTVESERITRYAFSYAGTEVSGDTVFNENFTLGDLPADWYTVTVGEGGRVRFRQLMYVYPNRTTWLNVVLN